MQLSVFSEHQDIFLENLLIICNRLIINTSEKLKLAKETNQKQKLLKTLNWKQEITKINAESIGNFPILSFGWIIVGGFEKLPMNAEIFWLGMLQNPCCAINLLDRFAYLQKFHTRNELSRPNYRLFEKFMPAYFMLSIWKTTSSWLPVTIPLAVIFKMRN